MQAKGAEEAKAALLEKLLPAGDRAGPPQVHLCVVGVNHSTMPVEFREKLAAKHHFVSELVASPKLYLIGDDDNLTDLKTIEIHQ